MDNPPKNPFIRYLLFYPIFIAVALIGTVFLYYVLPELVAWVVAIGIMCSLVVYPIIKLVEYINGKRSRF